MDFTTAGWRDRGLAAAFAAIALLVGGDAIFDFHAGVPFSHIAIEVLVVTIALVATGLLVRDLRRETRQLGARLEASRADASRWRAEAEAHLQGLGAAIDRQFESWRLTAAEKDTALLLLKGFSHKDVARLRSVSEATARQQAVSVYRKAGVSSRNDLAAYFLEDLALPGMSRAAAPAPPDSAEKG